MGNSLEWMGTPDTVVRTSLVWGLGVKASQMPPLQAGLLQDLLRGLIFTPLIVFLHLLLLCPLLLFFDLSHR